MFATKEAIGVTSAARSSNVTGQDAQEKRVNRSGIDRQLCNTKMCLYYMKGACTYGDKCTFAHSLSRLHAAPDLKKTRLCKAFNQGSCNDTGCNFAHGDEELRSTANFFKKTLCVWFEKVKCRNGQQCRFAHGLTELRMQESSAKAARTPGATATMQKMKAWSGGFAAREADNVNSAPCLNYHEPMKVNPPSVNSRLMIPTLEYSNPLFTNYMLQSMVQQCHSAAQEVKQTESNRAFAQEFGRLHEHVCALSLQYKMLQQQTQDGCSPLSVSTMASDFNRGISEGSSDSDVSRSRSQDVEFLSSPPGLQ